MAKSKLQSEIKALETKITDLRSNLNLKIINRVKSMEADPLAYFEDEITAKYDESLDEAYSDVFEALPFWVGSPSEAMKEHDNIMYTEGLNNFADSYDLDDFEEYESLVEEMETLENHLEDLESELDELKEELEELEYN